MYACKTYVFRLVVNRISTLGEQYLESYRGFDQTAGNGAL